MTSGGSAASSAAYLRVSVRVAAGPSGYQRGHCGRRSSPILQALLERRERGCASGSSAAIVHENANPPHPLRLLRTRRQRPCGRRAAEKRDELARLMGFPQFEDHR